MIHQTIFLLSLILLAALIYFSHSFLMPLLLALVFAYLLLPFKRFFLRLKFSNLTATTLIMVPTVSFFASALFLVIPAMQEEIFYLMEQLPEYVASISNFVEALKDRINIPDFIQKSLDFSLDFNSYIPGILNVVRKSIIGLFYSTQFFTVFISYSILLPIFIFYLLKDWEYIKDRLKLLIPRPYLSSTSSVLNEIDGKLSGYIRGQFILSSIFMIYYTFFFNIIGLQHATTIGILTGMFFFIPFLTFAASFIVGATVAFFQFDLTTPFFAVIAVYLTAQFLENFILTPRIMGKKLGLSPLWILFSLYLGGQLMGVLGVLIAIPTAAIISVLLKQIMKTYLSSAYYNKE